MSRRDAVRAVLQPLREAMDADGGTLEVVECEGESLEVELTLRPDACSDCMLPDDQLEMMVADAVRDISPAFQRIRVSVT